MSGDNGGSSGGASTGGSLSATPSAGANDALALLRQPATIRLRCRAILQAVLDERSAYFRIDSGRLDEAADRVAALTRRRFPDLTRIALHSRWRHFEAGGVDRKAELDRLLEGRSAHDAARARIDLTVVSVLLDAGAGGVWRYVEGGQEYRRSEGLGVASLRAFMQGRFSARPDDDPLRADAERLATLDGAALKPVFQITGENPMIGLEGRAALLARLGRAMIERQQRAGAGVAAGGQGREAARKAAATAATTATTTTTEESTLLRPSQIYDRLLRPREEDGSHAMVTTSAAAVLAEVLRLTAPAWASGSVVMGQPAGDMWTHRWAGDALPGGQRDRFTAGVVPFHKLSQWLTYSLIEPLQWAGVTVTAVEELTGLPEYRNGGLLLDTGVIVPRDAHAVDRRWKPGDEFIVEWRALTVALLDEVADRVRERLAAPALPLACILEGGTWAAGREIAAERRAGGVPPLVIESDGTIF